MRKCHRYTVESAVREWYKECDGIGVPCVHIESDHRTARAAKREAERLAKERLDEVIAVRDYKNGVVIELYND